MISRFVVVTLALGLLTACASSGSGRTSLQAQCDQLMQPSVGRPIDALIASMGIGQPDMRTAYVDTDQPGVAHWRVTVRMSRRQKCGRLDVYTDADDIVTGFNFWNPGFPRIPADRR